MVNLAKRSWTLQGSLREARFDNTVIVRSVYFSNNSKSDMRLRVKKGRASERCYNDSLSAIKQCQVVSLSHIFPFLHSCEQIVTQVTKQGLVSHLVIPVEYSIA